MQRPIERPYPTPRIATTLPADQQRSRVFQWQPVAGKPVAVRLVGTLARYSVYTFDGAELGELFKDENPAWGWRWRRVDVQETRGGGLATLDEAASNFLGALRREGKL